MIQRVTGRGGGANVRETADPGDEEEPARQDDGALFDAAEAAGVAAQAPSHLRSHPHEIKVTLPAAYLFCRGREITGALVDLLIATVHRINARAETKVVGDFVAGLKRVLLTR
ncbi:hypothetical protein [Nonomuraea sp. B19D2]|uniref:hypothetical protein n=1 Tax=Nonomuraea sp. B19D2 TaxID=3159561 RepID=UPI0032DB9A1E